MVEVQHLINFKILCDFVADTIGGIIDQYVCSVDVQSEYLNLTCNRDGDCGAVDEETRAEIWQLHVNIDRDCMYLMNILINDL